MCLVIHNASVSQYYTFFMFLEKREIKISGDCTSRENLFNPLECMKGFLEFLLGFALGFLLGYILFCFCASDNILKYVDVNESMNLNHWSHWRYKYGTSTNVAINN